MWTREKLLLLAIMISVFCAQSCKPITRLPAAMPVQPTLTLALLTKEQPTRNKPLEFSIVGIPPVANPFDPREVNLEINFVDATGLSATVTAFWYADFNAADLRPQGVAGWRARFTPTNSGPWRATATLQSSSQSSNELSFTVEESAAPGFVHVDPSYPRYFAYDDGTRFLPVGINMGWWRDNPLENYTRWLDHFAANGGNTIRVWMADWAFAIEWNDTPLGDYRPRLQQAWLLDELFRLAAQRGIQVILVLNHHGQFSQSVNPEWEQNPYNAALGGPLRSPEQFVSDATAIALFQQRLRYIVARWGPQPNLLAWDWWNEYNFTPIDDKAMSPWLQSMGDFLATHDLYHHPTTLSGPGGPASPVWQLPEIDFVSVHLYTMNDLLGEASELVQNYAKEAPNKPFLLEEFGYATGEEGIDSTDKTGIHLHNGLWASLFSGHAGSGMYWWWDTYLEPLNLWFHFASLAHFFAAIDPAQFTPAHATIVTTDSSPAAAEGLLLEGKEQTLMWVRSNHYTAQSVTTAYDAAVRDALRNKRTFTAFTYDPPTVSDQQVVIPSVEADGYRVEWFDPQSGEWGKTEEFAVEGGMLTIPLPTFSKDIAARITRLP
jgi:hypothetical protein